MQLDVAGNPLHARALAVTLVRRKDERLDARGELVDLRKRGVVPVAGDLQTPGLIHHMRLDAVVDPATTRLDAIQAAQPAVAFEASALSAGESCRDPIDRVAALAGARLDDGFTRAVGAALGGPRGCSHIVTLSHLLGSTVAGVLADGLPDPGFHPGERVFRRDVVVDGYEPAPGRLLLAAQLTDVRFAPAPAIASPMTRFAGQHEIRLLARIDLARFALEAVTGAERRRGRDDLSTAAWQSRDGSLAPLAGLGLTAGVTAALLDRFGGRPTDRDLLDVLLMLAPTLIQCMAALSESWLAGRAGESRIGMGGLPDSCYMWRRGGALIRARDA